MPLYSYRDVAGVWTQLPTPSVFIRPNDDQLMFEFVQQTVATMAIYGTAFVWSPMQGTLPIELRNIHPDKVRIKTSKDGEVYYCIGKEEYDKTMIRQLSWLRLPNNDRSIAPIDALRNILGTDIAITRFLAAFYGEGGTPSSVLETDQQLTNEQAKVLRDTWVDMHYKTRRPAVLTGGLRWKSITASANDMDTMAHREQIVREIARFYRIPLHLMGGTGGDSQTYQNVESAGIQFVRHTLLPWMRRLEDALSDMLPLNERVRFDADEFMRADLNTRVRASQVQIASGTLTPNEARQIEGRERYEGGDNFILNLPGAPMAGGTNLPPLGTDS
jgi:HK97 family phage portal protein